MTTARKKTPSRRPPGKAGRATKRASKRGRGRKKARSGRQRLVLTLTALVFLGAAGLLTMVGVFAYYSRDLPTVAALRDYEPAQVTRIVDRRGAVLNEVFEERRTVVPMERIPRVLVLSVLAAEDADFYRHRGLDYAGIVRALLRDAISGRAMQGASTITQQIVKNVLLTPERTIERKVRELILARRLEQELSKDDILGLYLNHIYFGHGRYGVQEASLYYFGKDVSELSLAEASLMAGIPQAPARLSPAKHPQAAKQRQQYVLTQLSAKRLQYWPDLTEAQIDGARTEKVKVVADANVEGGAPEVVGQAKRVLLEAVGEQAAKRGGYTVKTTIDLALQAKVRAALRRGLERLDARRELVGPLRKPGKRTKRPKQVAKLRVGRAYDAVVTGTDDATGTIRLSLAGHGAEASLSASKRFNPEQLPASKFAPKGARVRASVLRLPTKGPVAAKLEIGPQGAVVVIDPRSREVLALVGGDRATYGFNRATQAVRQPGSTFKPIAYGLALDSGKYTPASLVLDAPEVYDEWKPDNYETRNYAGAVRLRQGLAKSINLVAVRVTADLTPASVAEFARDLGIETKLEEDLALSLGASGVRPIELVNAYATFASGGRYQRERLVRSIVRGDGERIAMPEQEPPRDVMQPAAAYLLTSMLQSVVQEGTARAARKLKRPAAGKTGTSNKARDAWFVGFTPEIVVGVWIGYDDHRPLGRGESGAKTALPIWLDVVKAAVGDRPPVDFPVPSGVVRVQIDPKSGKLAYEGQEDALEEVFLAGTEPTESAPPPDVVDERAYIMQQL
ncbi:MAG: PBP1A family penicillin-binding protein [Myxococcales bacterium]|nr:PBP1A family penicillin-binding protein [Myxococcales bacterium]